MAFRLLHWRQTIEVSRSSTTGGHRDPLTALLEDGLEILLTPRDLNELLRNYESTVRAILAARSLPGVISENLDRFKRDFSTSAFTCRFPYCKRATLGFTDEKSRLEHETSYVQRINCTFQGCQYPPFGSARALKAHVTKCHPDILAAPKLRRIRDRLVPQTPTHGHELQTIQEPHGSRSATTWPEGEALEYGMPEILQAERETAEEEARRPTLQEHQLQLMLLEQQNKKRLMMSRQEQDDNARMTQPVPLHTERGTAEKEARRVDAPTQLMLLEQQSKQWL